MIFIRPAQNQERTIEIQIMSDAVTRSSSMHIQVHLYSIDTGEPMYRYLLPKTSFRLSPFSSTYIGQVDLTHFSAKCSPTTCFLYVRWCLEERPVGSVSQWKTSHWFFAPVKDLELSHTTQIQIQDMKERAVSSRSNPWVQQFEITLQAVHGIALYVHFTAFQIRGYFDQNGLLMLPQQNYTVLFDVHEQNAMTLETFRSRLEIIHLQEMLAALQGDNTRATKPKDGMIHFDFQSLALVVFLFIVFMWYNIYDYNEPIKRVTPDAYHYTAVD